MTVSIDLSTMLAFLVGAMLMLYAILCYIQWSELKDMKVAADWKREFRWYMWPSGWLMLKLKGASK